MPGKSGIETCAELRRMRPRLAILIVSVIDDYERRIQALEAGADDYVTKPFHMRELTARIRASLRRTRTSQAIEMEDIIEIGDLSVNAARRLVMKAGSAIHLTPKEFDLLHYLMSNPACHYARTAAADRLGATVFGQVSISGRLCASCERSWVTMQPVRSTC